MMIEIIPISLYIVSPLGNMVFEYVIFVPLNNLC